jgi:type VI secretion system protein ImpM
MVVNALRAPGSQIQPLVFGKLPHRSDFVRINATHPVALEFDDLVQTAMQLCRAQAGWEDRYDRATMSDFCYRSRDRRWIFLGALAPSQDESGRRYPLMAGAAFPAQALGGDPSLLPLACEVFYEGLREQLSSAVENSVEGLACRQFLESQARLWAGETSDLQLAEEILRPFMERQHPSDLEAAMAGHGPTGTLAQALLNITFYRDFLRRFNVPSNLQMLTLPLTGSRGVAALHASAWLHLLGAMCSPDEPRLGGYLLQPGKPGERAHLHACLGPLPFRGLLPALGGELSEDCRLDLYSEIRPWQSHKLYAEIAYAMDRLLADTGVALSNLSGFLREVCVKVTQSC